MIKNFTFILFFISIICNAQKTLDENLLVFYKFNGDMNDTGPNELHASGNAVLIEDRFGNQNSAYQFNGIDEFIDFPNDDLFEPQLPISFSFWVNFEDLEVTKTFVFTSDYSQNLNTGINLSMTSASSNIAIAYGDGGAPSLNSRRTKIGTTSINVNKWYLIVGIIRSSLDMDIYLSEFNSGSLLCFNDNGTYSGNGNEIVYSDNPGTIGRTDANSSTPPFYFKGKVDEFRMWDKALTIIEIDELCQNENTLSTTNFEFLQFAVFFNSDEEVVQFKNLSKNNNVKIYNSLGQLLKKLKNVSDRIIVNNLKSGFYILKIEDDKGRVSSFKFII